MASNALVSHSAAYDAWFREKVLEALQDKRPYIDDKDAETRFRARRAAPLRKAEAFGE